MHMRPLFGSSGMLSVALQLLALGGAAALSVSPAGLAAQGRALCVRMGSTSEEMGIPCVGECAMGSYPKLPESVHPGVVTGKALDDLLNDAKVKGYAIPAVNCGTLHRGTRCTIVAPPPSAPMPCSSALTYFCGSPRDAQSPPPPSTRASRPPVRWMRPSSSSSRRAARSFTLARVSTIPTTRRRSRVRCRARSTCARWPSSTASPSSFTPTTAPRTSFRGSTAVRTRPRA